MLTTAEVAKLTGVSYRQLDYWARLGVLQPEHNAKGSGSRRRWPTAEIRIALVLGRYANLCAGPNSVGGNNARIRKDIAEATRNAPPYGWVVIGPDHTHIAVDDNLAWSVDLFDGGAVVIALPDPTVLAARTDRIHQPA